MQNDLQAGNVSDWLDFWLGYSTPISVKSVRWKIFMCGLPKSKWDYTTSDLKGKHNKPTYISLERLSLCSTQNHKVLCEQCRSHVSKEQVLCWGLNFISHNIWIFFGPFPLIKGLLMMVKWPRITFEEMLFESWPWDMLSAFISPSPRTQFLLLFSWAVPQ